MSSFSLSLPLPGTARRAAFGKIVLNEARLAWRRPIGLIGGVGIPVLLGLPIPLVTYCELGVLRRLSTTSVPQSWLVCALGRAVHRWALPHRAGDRRDSPDRERRECHRPAGGLPP